MLAFGGILEEDEVIADQGFEQDIGDLLLLIVSRIDHQACEIDKEVFEDGCWLLVLALDDLLNELFELN